jgi:hypothetical protein
MGKKTTPTAPEFAFTATEFDSGQISYYVNFYPEGKSAAENSESDEQAVPDRLTSVTATLQKENMVLAVSRAWGDAADPLRNIAVDFSTHKSQIGSVGDARSTVTLRSYSKLGTLRPGALSLGSDPDIFYAFPFDGSPVNDVQIVGQVVQYSLEGKKTKVLDQIDVKIFVKNTSGAGCYVMLSASHEAKGERSTLISPGAPESYNSQTQFVGPGETVELVGLIYPRHFEASGIAVPAVKDLSKLKIFPLLCIYGDPQSSEASLEKPTMSD